MVEAAQETIQAKKVYGTKINKIVCTGFKSFATRTELLFGDKFNVVLGPNGSGKSCSYDTLVQLSNGEKVQIGELVENQVAKSSEIKKLDDGIYVDGEPIEIISLNKSTGKTEIKPISKFVKREGEVIYRIKTRSGKEVKATGCHPVMAFKDGEIKSVVIKDLKEGSFIAAPRKIKIQHDAEFSPEYARLIGYLIGDGYLAKGRVEFINKDPEVIHDFKMLVERLFGVELIERQDKSATRLYINDKNTVKKIKDLFIKDCDRSITSERKSIPPVIFRTSNDVISELLAGLFDTDGYIRKDISIIEFCTKNKLLGEQVQSLLLRFGIISQVKRRMCSAKNTVNKTKRPYYYLYIYGQDNLVKFYKNIRLKILYKSEALELHCKKNIVKNPNNDLLPKEVNLMVKEVSNLLGVPIKPLRKSYPVLSAYIDDRCNPTRYGVDRILYLFEKKLFLLEAAYVRIENEQQNLVNCMEELNIPGSQASEQIGLHRVIVKRDWATNKFKAKPENLQKFYSFIQKTFESRLTKIHQIIRTLKILANSDIYWDPVVSIERLPKEQHVYDLTVEGNHNFIANDLFVHNSNILDALCFVLGKSSSKELRAEKAANLIYNGGKTKQPSKYGEVSIYFDNKDKIFPVEDEEIKVSRIVRQDGQSKYKINDKTKTRTEVLDLLAIAKIDPDGYNIILQGDITRFVKMSTVNRREIVEDISGIGIYEDKKQKALRELERVDERLKEAEIILNERESYLKTLKEDRDQAIKYKEVNDRISVSKASYLNIQIKRKEKVKEDHESAIKAHEEKIGKLMQEVDKVRSSINEKKEQIKKIAKEIEEQGEEGQLELNKEIEKLKTEVITAKTKIDSLNTELGRIEERKTHLKESLGEIDVKVEEIKKQSEELKKKQKSALDESQEIEKKLEAFRKKHSLDKSGEIEQEVEKIDAVIDEKQKESQELREQSQVLLREKDRIEFKLQNIDSVIEKVAEVESENKKQIDDLKNKRQEFKKAALELNKILNDDSGIAAQLNNARVQHQKLIEQLSKLKVQEETAKERAAGNMAVKRILEQKSKLGGIHGTVGEIGKVSSKYSAALEAAAGGKINNVIVDTDATASTCIKYLRDNKLGRATFLPLNKIKSPRENDEAKKLLGTRGVHDLAVNLVTSDARFKKIFSYVFGDSLVVDNIDVARRIGIGKAKMATIDGDLAEISGAMHGGYKQKSQGGFQTQEIEKEIKETDKSLAEMDSVVSRLEENKLKNEEAISRLRSFKANLEGEIIKLEKSLHLESGEIDASMKEKDLLKAQLDDLNNKINKLQSQISALNKDLASNKMKKNDLRSKMAHLRSPTLLAELTAFEQKKKEIQQKMFENDAEIKNNEVKVATVLDPEKGNMKKVREKMEKEEKDFKEEIKKLKADIQIKEKDLSEKQKKARAFYERFKTSFNERSKIQDLIQQDEEKVFQKEGMIRDFERKMNEVSIKTAEIRAGLSSLYEEFKKFGNVKLDSKKTEEELKKDINEFEKLMQNLGNVNMRALEIYDAVEKEYKVLLEKKDTLKSEKEDVLVMMNEIESNKKALFMETFNTINNNFKKIFSELSTKGEAYLEVENPEDPFLAGVNIRVRLTGSRFMDIKSLSGGEQTLTSLALIFAIQEHEPASFYVLDEIDAALDKRNAEKLAKLIYNYCDRAQYVVISHNDAVIQHGDILYGVSMDEHGISKVVSMKA